MSLLPPSPELQVLIRKELNEDLNTRGASLEAIKDWLAKQPHLPDTWDEDRLMNFLRGCNFSLERCKRKLDLYFTMRAAVPEFFSNRDIKRPELQKLAANMYAPPLPDLTPEGRRVIIFGGNQKAITSGVVEDAVKMFLMVLDICLGEEKVGVAGGVYIFDAAMVTPAFLAKISPAVLKQFLICTQKAYPGKIKEVHVVNSHPLFDLVYRLVKSFVKDKLIRRIYFHSNGYESLYKFVPKCVLPEEYGGTAGKLQDFHDDWMRKLEEYTPWFKEQEKYKADESKRPGKPTNLDDLFGIEGSFRKLSTD